MRRINRRLWPNFRFTNFLAKLLIVINSCMWCQFLFSIRFIEMDKCLFFNWASSKRGGGEYSQVFKSSWVVGIEPYIPTDQNKVVHSQLGNFCKVILD